MTSPGTLDAHIYISLDGTGAFTGASDEVTSKVAAEPGISISMGRDGRQQLTPPRIQSGGFQLINERGQFSPARAGSAYYQQLLPGRPVQFTVGQGTRTLYRSHLLYRSHRPYRGRGLWYRGRHVVDDISLTTEIGNRRVSITTLGYETVMTRAPVTVGVMVNPLVSECVTAILDKVSWPTTKRSIAVSDTRLLYWWCDERDPWAALLELLQSEGPGAIYVDWDGVFHFENRNYRSTAIRSTTSQATFRDRIDGVRRLYRAHALYRSHVLYRGRSAGHVFTKFSYDPGFKNIRNRATYTVRQRSTAASAVIWSAGADIVLSAAPSSRTFIVRPTSPFINAITPVVTTDWTVAGGTISVSMSAASGLVAFITITALTGTPTVSGPSASPTTGFQLRAQALTQVSETTVQNSVDASASIAAFSPIPGQSIPLTLQVAGWPEIDVPNAEAVCNSWVLRQQLPRPSVSFTLQNINESDLETILLALPSNRYTLVETNSGADVDVWLNAATLNISGAAGRTVTLDVGAEVCDDLTGAVWDVDEWDDTDHGIPRPFTLWGT